MIIMIDMDDTIEQLVKGWCKYMNVHYGTTTTPDDVHEWDLSLAFPEQTSDQVYAAEKTDEIWDYVEPIPGAAEVMQQLIADGHELYIVTNTLYESLRAKMDKVLFKYFPFIDWDHVIITKNKHIINGDVLIDDGIHNLTGGNYKKILFTANHNRNFDAASIGAVRADNWKQVYEIINRM